MKMKSVEDIFAAMQSGKDVIVATDINTREIKDSPLTHINCPWCKAKLECTDASPDIMTPMLKREYKQKFGKIPGGLKSCFCPCCSVGKKGFLLVPVGTVYAIEGRT